MYLSFDLFSLSMWRAPSHDFNLHIGYVTMWPKNMPDINSRGFNGSLLTISYSNNVDDSSPFYFDFLYIRGIIGLFRKQDNDIK